MTKIKATPAKPSRSKKTVEEEVEVEEEITPPKAKGKGILGALSGRLKRKQGDRSPGEEPSNNPPSCSSVRVIVPLPPRPLSDYVQLGACLSQPPFASPASPSFETSMGPPLSTLPSFSSFKMHDSGPGRNYEAEQLGILLNVSQENLQLQQAQSNSHIALIRSYYEERERRLQAAFELERAQFRAQFDELSQELREIREQERHTGGSSRFGEGSRRG